MRIFPAISSRSKKNNSGVALIIVLGMLALIVVLMVAFVSSVSTELQSAKSYANGQDAKTLADSAVNIVISQIQDATENPRQAWASQPGLIRTYDTNGAAVTAFKLYSSDNLRVSGNFHPINNQSDEIPGDWSAKSNQFVDLNKPVAVAGTNRYPILNPSAVAKDSSGGVALDGTTSAIEGCFLDTTNAAAQTSAIQSNTIPMPVRWMYVLKDGKIAPFNSASQQIVGATKDNPIVGRFAFWTDDESSKVNVNTSSEGNYWDRPWTESVLDLTNDPTKGYEKKLSNMMPLQNEFQRYPGHPAMNSLSVIFPAQSGESVSAYNERIYGIIPRIVGGGSKSGTTLIAKNSTPLVPDTQRLFATVDEFLFQVSTGSTRTANPKATGTFTENDIEKARFFITTKSRTPEVNLFNKPRITLWPLQIDPDPVNNNPTRNSKDKLIAFCSTIGTKPYYFQRYSTYNESNLSAVPSSQSPVEDWEKIPRNRELYAYLQYLTSNPIPGLGGNLLAKYPNSRDQILTEMYDFLRSGVNTFSSGDTPKYYYVPFSPSGFVSGQSQVVPSVLPNGTKGFGRFNTITEAALIFYRMDKLTYRKLDSANLPIDPVLDVPDAESESDEKVEVYQNNPPPAAPSPMNIGMVLILEPFNPTPGPPAWSSSVRYVVKGLNTINIAGSTMTSPFPSTVSNLVTGQDTTNNQTAQTGLEQALQYQPATGSNKHKTLGTDEKVNYPFFASFTLPAAATSMSLAKSTITIEIYPGTSTVNNSSTLIQKITVVIPRVLGLKIPVVDYSANTLSPSFSTTDDPGIKTNKLRGNNWLRDYSHRLGFLRNFPYQDPPVGHNGGYGIAEDQDQKPRNQTPHTPLPLIVTGDTVRSAEARYAGPARGDYRLFAGLKEVPENFFEGHGLTDPPKGTPAPDPLKLYSDVSEASKIVHSLTIDGMAGPSDTFNQNGYYQGAGSNATEDPRGKLVKNVAYPDPNRGDNVRNRKVPVVPRGLEEALMSNGKPGDWDTGPAHQPDGPYINRPDEATAPTAIGDTGFYYSNGGYVSGSGTMESGSSLSPNRQIASAVAFGSLPTGINPSNPDASKPWQTLLFCKNPAAGKDHPGFGVSSTAGPTIAPPYSTPPDHAFLDFFTMPIVEPYAISEPFSSDGKINMNYQIVPFTYLTRDTGIRSVLKSTKMMAIPQSDATKYKLESQSPPTYRYAINPDEINGTLKGFETRFQSGDVFRSSSEICDIYLVPSQKADGTAPPGTPGYSNMDSWWDNYKLTGDNVRESPYAHIYPRLTTKSNTYTVHVQTQSLKKATGTTVDTFVDGKDLVTGEFRGSFIIERYLDPNTDSLIKSDGSPGTETDADSMVGPYKFRVLSSKRFAP